MHECVIDQKHYLKVESGRKVRCEKAIFASTRVARSKINGPSTLYPRDEQDGLFATASQYNEYAANAGVILQRFSLNPKLSLTKSLGDST